MPTSIYWIHQFENSAKLAIMARPRGDDWLQEEITHLKKQNVGLLVSLLEKEEILELGLQQEEKICKDHGIEFINFPIVDRDVPTQNDKTDVFIKMLSSKIKEGISIAIHCRMGIGRSSIIAASILIQKGLKAVEIIENISKIRGLKVPDTDEQIKWLKKRQ